MVTSQHFHGFYSCDIGTPCPSYSAGFLASREQLLSNPVTQAALERENTNMETASYWSMGRRRNKIWRTVDAMDFTFEHLSMYERMVGSQRMTGVESPLADALYEDFLERLRAYESKLRHRCGKRPADLGPYANRTIGVMPFYAAGGAGSGHTRFESKALYLNITIYSIMCHFGGVAVSCINKDDRAYLEAGRGLPPIDDILWVDPASLVKFKPSFLGVTTIKTIQQRWTTKTMTMTRETQPSKPPFIEDEFNDENPSNKVWARFDFVLYTEADQVLRIRPKHREKLFHPLLVKQSKTHDERARNRVMDINGGKLAIMTPHRLNNVPRWEDFEELERAFAAPAYGDRNLEIGLEAAGWQKKDRGRPPKPPRAGFPNETYAWSLGAAERASQAAKLLRASQWKKRVPKAAADEYDPVADPWHWNLFSGPQKGDVGLLHREAIGYGQKKLTRLEDDEHLSDMSCCYLKRGEHEYPYTLRGKAGGVRLDDTVAGEVGTTEDRSSDIQTLAFGEDGLGVLSGLCCHICSRRGKLGRHCDNFCIPAKKGEEDCGVGVFADQEVENGLGKRTFVNYTKKTRAKKKSSR